MNAPTESMLAARLHGRNDLRVEAVPVPPVGKGEVRLRVAYAGICGSDLHELAAAPLTCRCAGDPHPLTGETLPTTLGHEFSGTVVELGEGVTCLRIGARVCVETVISCLECPQCLAGNRPLCRSMGFFGFSRAGGLAPFVNVTAKNCHIVPDSVTLRQAALAEPLSVAFNAVRKSSMKEGDRVLVLGSGPIGALVVRVLKSRGASWIAVSEPSSQRAAIAAKCGADLVLDPRVDNVVERLRKSTGGQGVDIAIDCAGIQSTLDTALSSIRPSGVAVMVALWERPAQLDLQALVLSEKQLRGSCCYTSEDMVAVLKALEGGQIAVDDLVTGVINLKDINAGVDSLRTDPRHIKILVDLQLER